MMQRKKHEIDVSVSSLSVLFSCSVRKQTSTSKRTWSSTCQRDCTTPTINALRMSISWWTGSGTLPGTRGTLKHEILIQYTRGKLEHSKRKIVFPDSYPENTTGSIWHTQLVLGWWTFFNENIMSSENLRNVIKRCVRHGRIQNSALLLDSLNTGTTEHTAAAMRETQTVCREVRPGEHRWTRSNSQDRDKLHRTGDGQSKAASITRSLIKEQLIF